MFSLDRVLPSFFPQAELCCHFSSPLPQFSQHVCSPKSKHSVRSRNPLARKQKNKEIEFYRSEGKLYLLKGLIKICSPAQWSCSPRLFFFSSCCYVGWKHLYALKALISTFKHLSGLSAYFGVTDFFKTTDFSGRKKHVRCKPSTARGAGENRAFTS